MQGKALAIGTCQKVKYEILVSLDKIIECVKDAMQEGFFSTKNECTRYINILIKIF